MSLTLEFLWNLGRLLGYVLPVFTGLALIIGVLSVVIGRREQWSVGDSLYFGFITALTVGYGDFRPSRRLGKFLAIVIALFGLIASGILVAVAIEALAITFEHLGA
ncbi:MAG: potassium channel family protein [Haliea sp.]|jgi:voltage-gated potassium channel